MAVLAMRRVDVA